jgi:hypothetical protein
MRTPRIALLVVLISSACSPPGPPDESRGPGAPPRPEQPLDTLPTGPVAPEPHPPRSPATLPATQPGIQGIVTSHNEQSVLVEENPLEETGSPKALVRVAPETAVLFRNGTRGSPGDLTIGHNVSVWFRGPVMESYPVQGTASQIVIEPAGVVGP